MNWLKVEDQLPEIHELCLVFDPWHGVKLAEFWQDEKDKPGYFIRDGGIGGNKKDQLIAITHWLRLPEPPEE